MSEEKKEIINNENPKVKKIKLIVQQIKEISCYYDEKLPQHQECPYQKTEIDEKCGVCVRKQEKMLQIQVDKIDESKMKPNLNII